MAKVSVIVPVYNNEEKLENCIKSLVSQNMECVEIILVDDASTDNSLNIMNNYKMIFPNIKIHHNNSSLGIGVSINIGLSMASGEYIAFADSDDYVSTDMYENMYNSAVKNNYPDIVNTLFTYADDGDMADFDLITKSKGMLRETKKDKTVFYDINPSFCNKLFKRELIGDYKFLDNCFWEDRAFTYSMLLKSNTVLDISEPNNLYKKNNNEFHSFSWNKYNPRTLDIIKVCDEIEKFAKDNNVYDENREQIKFIQISSVLLRIGEIYNWDVDSNVKKKIIDELYFIMCERYGSIDSLDRDLLACTVGFQIIDRFSEHNKNRRSM